MAVVLIAAPQIEEAEALLGGFAAGGFAAHATPLGALTAWRLPQLDMVVAVGGNGKAQFGVQAQYLIDRCPGASLLVCAGAAGRLADTVAVGDVVVGTAVVEHDYRERFIEEPLPRHDCDEDVVTQFTRAAGAREWPFGVHVGPIASGDEDIVHVERAAHVRAATNALCVAWEGSGGARAARFNGIGFIEIRAVTDNADEQAASAFHGNVRTVMPHVSAVILAWHAAARAAV
jgi:adenosylhomocysteine nucleosidase